MSLKISPVSKIIGLSGVLAVGFLMVVLAAAVWGNWMTLLAAFLFAIAHLPTLLFHGQYSYEESIDDIEGTQKNGADFAGFLESLLLTSAVVMPLSLYHCHEFTKPACILTTFGGALIYGTIVTFTTFFNGFSGDDDDPFNV